MQPIKLRQPSSPPLANTSKCCHQQMAIKWMSWLQMGSDAEAGDCRMMLITRRQHCFHVVRAKWPSHTFHAERRALIQRMDIFRWWPIESMVMFVSAASGRLRYYRSVPRCPSRQSELPAGALKWQRLLMTDLTKHRAGWCVLVKWGTGPVLAENRRLLAGQAKGEIFYFSAPGNTISKSRIGAFHYTKYTSHKSLPFLFLFRSFFSGSDLLENISASLSQFPLQSSAVLCPAGHSQRDNFHTSLSSI